MILCMSDHKLGKQTERANYQNQIAGRLIRLYCSLQSITLCRSSYNQLKSHTTWAVNHIFTEKSSEPVDEQAPSEAVHPSNSTVCTWCPSKLGLQYSLSSWKLELSLWFKGLWGLA